MHEQVRVSIEDAEVTNPALGEVVDVAALPAAPFAAFDPPGVGVQLNPHLRIGPLAPRLEPLDHADSVPLPASEPTDRLGLGHGGLLLLDATTPS